MKTIKSIFATLVMVFVGFAAGAQVQDESQTPGQSETSYEYEQETNTDGSVESETDYYSETEIDNQETETEFNSETESESSWSQTDTEQSGQTEDWSNEQSDNQSSEYLGATQSGRTEIEPERLPDEVVESIVDSEYANWAISGVYEINTGEDAANDQGMTSPEDGTIEEQNEMAMEDDFKDQDQTGESGQTDEFMSESSEEVVYEIHFESPDGTVETERYDSNGQAR